MTRCPMFYKNRSLAYLFGFPDTWHNPGGFHGDNLSVPAIPDCASKSLFFRLLSAVVGRHNTCYLERR